MKALITGASRGIGRAVAIRLARDGHSVVINYRTRREEAESVVREIGPAATAIQADITDRAQVTALVAAAGEIDILVNNAGILNRGDLEDFDFSQMHSMRNTNVDGLVAVTRAVVPGMKARQYGRIVNLTSIAAHGTAMAGTTFYAATKAAVIALTRRFAMDLGPHGITVNAIAPGFIMTDLASGGPSREAMAAKAMVRRVGAPEDIAHAVSFLASEGSGFLTAQVLTVDGGRMDYIAHP